MADALILASASPRRSELLSQIGVSFNVVPADIDETPAPSESATSLVERLARAKAVAVAAQLPNRVILAADTVVFVDGADPEIFGKPVDQADALRMLETLSDRVHRVATGMALHDGAQIRSQVVITQVTFAAISHADAVRYWQSGECVGKAGAYAIQGLGARFVVGIQGSYSNVVGLPLHETSVWLQQAGIIA